MTIDAPRWPVTRDRQVRGADGGHVGIVKAVYEASFLVERERRPDLIIPFDAIQDVDGNRICLTVPAGAVDRMGWPSPEPVPD
jgi:hypothetical protein